MPNDQPSDTTRAHDLPGTRLVRLPEALTVGSLQATLLRDLGSEGTAFERIVFDATGMRSYTSDARAEFVIFVRGLPKATRIGVITDRPLWRMVLSAISLAASREIKVFATRAEAAASR